MPASAIANRATSRDGPHWRIPARRDHWHPVWLALADLSRFAEARSDYPGVSAAIEEIKTRLGPGR